MAGLETVLPAQPVVKDVQTLKANLKEQEKRVRSESKAQEVVPGADHQPTGDEELRKRRKVTNPVEPNEESEVIVLDGPFPPTTTELQPKAVSSTPPKIHESSVAQQKDAGLAPNSNSPAKVADVADSSEPSKSLPDAPLTPKRETDKSQPLATSKSVESPSKPVASNAESSASDENRRTEQVEATATSKPEVKDLVTPAEPAAITDKAT